MTVKNFLYVAGAIFIVAGLLGFVNNPVFGLLRVDTIHNIIHLATGVLSIVFAGKSDSDARKFALAFGVVYGLVMVLGFLTGTGDDLVKGSGKILGLITINGADNYFHLIVTAAYLYFGLTKPAGSSNPTV